MIFREGNFYANFSTFVKAVSLNEVSPVINAHGSTSAFSPGVKLSGGYFFTPAYGVGLSVDHASIQVAGISRSLGGMQLTGRHRWQIGKPSDGYFLYSTMGLESRDYFMPLPFQPLGSSTGSSTGSAVGGGSSASTGSSNQNQGISDMSMSSTGAHLGFDFRKQFDDRWALGGQLQYFYPLSVNGQNQVQGLASSGLNRRNLNIGTQGFYWFNRKMGLNAGAYYEMKSLAFKRDNYYWPKVGDGPETISMDSFTLVLGFTYSFSN